MLDAKKMADISGHQLAAGRSEEMLRRAFDILSAQNPDIDWNDHNIVLAIVPKDQRASDILRIWKIGDSDNPIPIPMYMHNRLGFPISHLYIEADPSLSIIG